MTLILQGTDNSVSSPAVQGGTAGTTTGVYYPATNQIALATNGTLGLIQDSAQNIGIGVVPSTAAWAAIGVGAVNALQFGARGSLAYYAGVTDLCINDAAGTYLVSSATAARYRQQSGYHYFSSAPTGTAGATITYTDVLAVAKDRSLALQGATSVASCTGITFPATQSASSNANTLDDYEEGTWTPVWTGTSSGSGSPGGSAGSYVKIGTLVMVTVEMNNAVPFITFSGTLQCSLPFTCGGASGGDQFIGPPMYYYTGGNWNTGATTAGITPTVSTGGTVMTFNYMLTNGDRQSLVTNSSCSLSGSNNTYARFCITYITS